MFSQRGVVTVVAPLVAVVLGLSGCSGSSGTPSGEAAPAGSSQSRAADEQAIRDTFERYRTALREQDGESVTSLVTAGTLDYYGELAGLTATGGPEEIGARGMTDRMNVAMLRHRLGAGKAEGMDGKALLIFAAKGGLVDKSAVEDFSLGEITVRGDTAVAAVSPSHRDGPQLPPRTFARESGQWRVDLLPMIENTDKTLAQLAEKYKLTEDEVIFKLVSAATGKQVGQSIFARP
ncbi:hypothetical protein SAXI111661_14905 [Saccharomonospora xinjiangensis]|nr:hypothetical protein EYD13_17360 [Saccharomonospora xinjiangensis]